MTIAPVPDAEDPAVAARVRLELRIHEEVARQIQERDTSGKEKKDGFWKHPAVLLVAGFLLTGIFGSIFTSWWQYQQWFRQQQYRAVADGTKARLEVIAMTTQSVAESFSAAEDVLHLFYWTWRPDSAVVTLKERAANWNAASRKWRASEKVLNARIASTFADPKAIELFQTISSKRRRLGNDVQNLLSTADEKRGTYSPEEEKEIKELRDDALSLINEVTGRDGILPQLVKVLLTEMQNRDRLPEPPSLFRWIFR